MMRMIFALIVSMLLVEIANGAQYPFFQHTMSGGVHQDGDAKWEDQAEQMTSIECAKNPPPKQPRDDLSDCLGASLHIKSQAKLVMECRLTLKIDRPDDSGRTRIETRALVGPGEDRWGAHSFGPNGTHIIGFSSQCITLPREPAKPLDIPLGCEANVVEPNEDYPVGLKRRRLEGRTVIEYTATSDGRMVDVTIVGSSSSVLVDEAALKYAARMKVKTNCSSQRFRHTVTFSRPDASPAFERDVVE